MKLILKRKIIIIIITLVTNYSFGQTLIKKYFLGSNDFYKTNNELVIIVDHPQTDFARELGSRYYNDTAFIKKISNEFFTEIDTSNHLIESHFCGYDIFFYSKRNNNLRLIRAINSNCDLNEFGIIDKTNQCKNLETLKSSGIELQIDSLHSVITEESKNTTIERLVFHRNIDVYENSRLSEITYWRGNNNCRNLPVWYYDGFVEESIKIEGWQSINTNIQSYFSSLGIDSVEYKTINWQIDPYIIDDFQFNEMMGYPTPDSIDITFYFTKEYFSNFEEKLVNYILIEPRTDIENSHRYILLYKIPK